MERIIRQHAVDDVRKLLYVELLAISSRLQRAVRTKHLISRDEPIGIVTTHGLNQVAQVAVRFANATCVPLDRDLLRDVGVNLVIVDAGTAPKLTAFDTVCIDDISTNDPDEEPSHQQRDSPKSPIAGTCEARSPILFTSGSTGTPKPVQLTEVGLIRLATRTCITPLQKTDRVAALNSPGFDLSLFGMWVTLLSGATIVAIPKQISSDPGALRSFLSFLHEESITCMIMPTALFNIVARVDPDSLAGLRHVLVAGEAANPKAMRAVLEAAQANKHGMPLRLWKAYGQTEGTV
ncbi:hypothetical protein BJY04DRAFT_225358 [Aspergillus karnatakaensis]|uniref:uncharacterized protein n=1 Tax=Aspergillus karnatakaensis TaxID=1810916 RepID=UPI003CCDC238